MMRMPADFHAPRLIGLAILASLALPAAAQTAELTAVASPPVRAAKHMVVAAHPLAAAAGRDVLRQGGSAVDAAIATQLVLTLVEPQSSGIAGGGQAGSFPGRWPAIAIDRRRGWRALGRRAGRHSLG
jgi:hypothetical protein